MWINCGGEMDVRNEKGRIRGPMGSHRPINDSDYSEGDDGTVDSTSEERYEESEGLIFRVSQRMNPSDLLQLLTDPIDDSTVNHGLPKEPPGDERGFTYSYLVSSDSIGHEDLSSDNLSPWTSSKRKAQCRSLGMCSLNQDGSISIDSNGLLEVRLMRLRHGTGRIVKTILKVMDTKRTTGIVLVSYSMVDCDVPPSPAKHPRKRISGGTRRIVRVMGTEGRTARRIMADVEGVKPSQVYHQMRRIERPRENRGPMPSIDYDKIHRMLTDRDNIPFNVSIGKEHEIYLFQSELMRQNFYESLVDVKTLTSSILQVQRLVDTRDEEGINVSYDPTRVEHGVMQVDVTFSVCEGFYLIIIGIYSHSMRTRSTGKQALLPVCLVLSRKHNRDVFRQIGLYLDTLLKSTGKVQLKMRSLMSDKEGSFAGLLEFEFSNAALPLDCHVHLLTNMITAGFSEGEVKSAKTILFGERDQFRIGSGGALNLLSEEDYQKEIDNLDGLSDDMKRWIRKRSNRMWQRMSLSARMKGGIGIRLPSNQALEGYNNIVKSQSLSGRRNLNGAFEFIMNEVKMIDGQFRSAFRNGGLLMVDENVPSSLPIIISTEETFIQECLIPVPRGSGRLTFEKNVRMWKSKRLNDNPIVLENQLGDIVGVSIDEEGKPRCGLPSCRLPGRASVCEHIAAVVFLGRSDVESFLVESRQSAPLHSLIPLNAMKGQKPGFRRKVPRRGKDPPMPLGIRLREEVEDSEESDNSEAQVQPKRRIENIERRMEGGEQPREEEIGRKRMRGDGELEQRKGQRMKEHRRNEGMMEMRREEGGRREREWSYEQQNESDINTIDVSECAEKEGFLSKLKSKGKKYQEQREEEIQRELEHIRSLADADVIVDGEEMVVEEEYEIGGTGEILNEMESVELEESIEYGETPILGDDTYRTVTFPFHLPSDEWRKQWMRQIGITSVYSSLPEASVYSFRIDEEPKDIVNTKGGTIYDALSFFICGTDDGSVSLERMLNDFRRDNEDNIFLPQDECDAFSTLRLFSCMTNVTCMIFLNGEWKRIHEGSRNEAEYQILYFLLSSNRIDPVVGVRESQRKVLYKVHRDFWGILPGELTLRAGDEVTVTKRDGDWWEGEMGSEKGLFPSNAIVAPIRRSKGNNTEKKSVMGTVQSRWCHDASERSIPSTTASDVAEVLFSKEALRTRSRKCGACGEHMTPTMKEKVLVSHTKKTNSKLYHLKCFKNTFPSATMGAPVSIGPFVLRSCSQSELNEIHTIFQNT